MDAQGEGTNQKRKTSGHLRVFFDNYFLIQLRLSIVWCLKCVLLLSIESCLVKELLIEVLSAKLLSRACFFSIRTDDLCIESAISLMCFSAQQTCGREKPETDTSRDGYHDINYWGTVVVVFSPVLAWS